MQNTFLIPVEKCLLCEQIKKQFTCNICIETGNFCASNLPIEDEKNIFSFKQKRLHVARTVKNDYQSRLEAKLIAQNEHNSKLNQLILLRSKISTLKIVLQKGLEKNEEDKKENEIICKRVDQRREFVKRLCLKTEKIKKSSSLQDKKLKLFRYKEKLDQKQKQLKELRRWHVQMLVNDIFPISEKIVDPAFGTPPRGTISTQYEPCDDVISESTSTAVSELEEATRTIHVGGKWISMNTEELEFTVVDAGMPTSGNFIKYYVWLKSYKNEPRSTDSNLILHHNDVMRIPAALFYSAQLTAGLSYLLDINLPNRIDLINFVLLTAPRKKLVRSINKLIENVMFLSFSQLVPADNLDPHAIIQNLKACVNSEYLGWTDEFEIKEVKTLEYQFDSDSSTEELTFESSGEEYEQEDWDRLHDLPEDQRNFEESIPERSLSSSASGLVTSAAASVASALWSWKR